MKYFCPNSGRDGTCYHEFLRGEWDGLSCWKADSICIHDDVMAEIGLDRLLKACVLGYDPWGPTAVFVEQWKDVRRKADQAGGAVQAAVSELDEWLRADEGMMLFTILGI